MSIEISKISYFSFTYKLNKKEEVLLKKYGLERGGARKFLWEGDLIFNKRLKYFQKSRA